MMRVWTAWLLVGVCGAAAAAAAGQGAEVAARKATETMADSVMKAWPNGAVLTTKNPGGWGYEEGVLLDGLAAEWEQTRNPAELAYIRAAVDKYVKADGTIQVNAAAKRFASEEHQLDNIELGRAILFVYRQTHEARYATAAKFLHEQLAAQPRGPSGGYWHKQIYPNQMWLDGAYMAEPFRAEYAAVFGVAGDWDDIAKQFLLMREHMYDPTSELLRHGWDESKQMAWADKGTGQSPQVWARAVGWYCMGLVDVLDWFPKDHPQRVILVSLLHQTLVDVLQYQDLSTDLWWQVMDRGPAVTGTLDAHAQIQFKEDRPAAKGNFLETSASAMFVYAIEKSVRLRYMQQLYAKDAWKGWQGVQKKFVRTEADGSVVLTGTVKAAGLGGTPYRSGTYEYYVGEKTGDDDAKGVGAYLLAGSEMGRAGRPAMKTP